ncbi:hypothetical protein DFH09DRAFT_1367558 [Mycena vulgaris]|nr:hypothetical protein DFH09DRAFT_1367558 [Mycena vulgaris]
MDRTLPEEDGNHSPRLYTSRPTHHMHIRATASTAAGRRDSTPDADSHAAVDTRTRPGPTRPRAPNAPPHHAPPNASALQAPHTRAQTALADSDPLLGRRAVLSYPAPWIPSDRRAGRTPSAPREALEPPRRGRGTRRAGRSPTATLRPHHALHRDSTNDGERS